MDCSVVIRFFVTLLTALTLFMCPLYSQQVFPSAAALPDGNGEVALAHKGQAVFFNAKQTFDQLPATLNDMAFVRASQIDGCKISLLTEGNVVVVTPEKGQPGSQDSALRAYGFNMVDTSLKSLLAGQHETLQMYAKQVDYKNFRLPSFTFKAWAIVFFSPIALPAHCVPAIVKAAASPVFDKSKRQWQGCPSIEKTGNRLWAAWFSGGSREPDTGNYGIVSYSDDEGTSWLDPAIIISHPDTSVRVMDPQLWKDPSGKLWIFWVQNQGAHGFDGLWSTWAVQLQYPRSKNLHWTKPKKLCNGLMRNKPVVLSNGAWLLPSYSWVPDYRSALYISTDKGKSWRLQGGPLNEGSQNFYEHMVVELKDKRLWLLQRNIQESYSPDMGKTWSALASVESFTSANSRLYFGRLQSGHLLLVYNNDPEGKTRRNLTAFLSTDDGKSWPFKIVIDERINVSYPDVTQDSRGKIYLCYDRGRTTDKEIILAEFTEDDLVKGKFPEGYKPKMISKVE